MLLFGLFACRMLSPERLFNWFGYGKNDSNDSNVAFVAGEMQSGFQWTEESAREKFGQAKPLAPADVPIQTDAEWVASLKRGFIDYPTFEAYAEGLPAEELVRNVMEDLVTVTCAELPKEDLLLAYSSISDESRESATLFSARAAAMTPVSQGLLTFVKGELSGWFDIPDYAPFANKGGRLSDEGGGHVISVHFFATVMQRRWRMRQKRRELVADLQAVKHHFNSASATMHLLPTADLLSSLKELATATQAKLVWVEAIYYLSVDMLRRRRQ
jgi:hypothetical protein